MKFVYFREDLIISREEVRALLRTVAGERYEPIWHDSQGLERVRDDVEIVASLDHYVATEKNLEQWPGVIMVSMGFTGYDKVDKEYCGRRQLKLYYVPDYSTDSVAELTIGLALALLRKIRLADQDVREGRWDKNRDAVPGIELRGKKVGILGTGKIGSASAKLFQAFGCEVTSWSKSHPADLDGIFAESDIIALHLPATPETKHVVDARRLALMKRTSVLINTARGELVDTAALMSSLTSKRILGAGIDVIDGAGLNVIDEQGRPIPPDGRSPDTNALLALPNVVVTPHVGFKTQEALRRLAIIVIENIGRYLADSPENRLDLIVKAPGT